MPNPQTATTRQTLFRLWQVIRPNKIYLFSSIFMSAAVSAIMLFALERVGFLVDLILKDTSADIFWPNALLLILLFASISLATLVQIYSMAILGQRLAADLRQLLYQKSLTLPLAFFDDHPTGDMMSRMTNDIDQVNTSFSDNLTSVIEAIVNVIGTFIAMAILSPKLTLWAATVFPLFFILTAIVSHISKQLFANYQKSLGALNTYIEEHLAAQSMLMLFDYRSCNLNLFSNENERVTKNYARAQTSSVMAPLMTFINHLVYITIAIIGGLAIIHDRSLSIGTLFTFLLYMRRFATPLNQLASIYNAFQATVAACGRIFAVLDAPSENIALGKNRQIKFPENHSISFENVTFSYKMNGCEIQEDGDLSCDQDTLVLQNITCTIPAGKTTAIVGQTGAGKTTFTNLLLSYYLPQKGRITIGDTDLATIPLEEIHQHISIMPQNPVIFDTTVLDNIGLAKPDADREAIIHAAKQSGFHAYVEKLPGGYDTVLHHAGATLSAGERQLLAVSRALLADASLLILDEPTSSLDAHTEKRVQHAFTELMQGKTTLIIAHRLSTIKNADHIIVMKNGRILEQGSHTQLIAAHGYYHKLYTSTM